MLRANAKQDNTVDAAERRRRRAAGEQANAEAHERFGRITEQNADEFIRWQEERILELCEGSL